MKQFALVLVFLTSCFRSSATDTSSHEPTAQELARQIITAFQAGRGSQIKSNLTADVSILEKGSRDFPNDPLIHFALATCYLGQDNKQQAAQDNMERAFTLSQKDVGIGTMYALVLKMNKQPVKAYALN